MILKCYTYNRHQFPNFTDFTEILQREVEEFGDLTEMHVREQSNNGSIQFTMVFSESRAYRQSVELVGILPDLNELSDEINKRLQACKGWEGTHFNAFSLGSSNRAVGAFILRQSQVKAASNEIRPEQEEAGKQDPGQTKKPDRRTKQGKQ